MYEKLNQILAAVIYDQYFIDSYISKAIDEIFDWNGSFTLSVEIYKMM